MLSPVPSRLSSTESAGKLHITRLKVEKCSMFSCFFTKSAICVILQ